MKTKFIPLDYDSIDIRGKTYIRIIGRDDKGKQICVLDSFEPFLWIILKEGINNKQIEALKDKIEKIKTESFDRTKVEKIELHDKNFLGKKVKALKIFITNYKDVHLFADQLDFSEIEARREYDINIITKYINEKGINPCSWFEVSGEIINSNPDFGNLDKALDVSFCIKAEKIEKIKDQEFSPKILAFDIETDELEIGKGEILMISLVGKNLKKVLTWKKTKEKPEFVECFKENFIFFSLQLNTKQ